MNLIGYSALFVCVFFIGCSYSDPWPMELPHVAIANSNFVDLATLYNQCEIQANNNESGSRNGRIGTRVVIAQGQANRNLSLEIRMYAVKTADVWHTHVPNEILCVSQGSGLFTSSSGETWSMSPGDCTLMTGAVSHYFQSYNTNSTGNYTVLLNTFLPTPFQRTDNMSAPQNWTYPSSPVRNTFAQGILGISGSASQPLSSITTNTQLVNKPDVSIFKVVGTNNQILKNASLNVDSNFLVQQGTVTITAVSSGLVYNLAPGDFFVLPANVTVNALVTSTTSLSLLVFNSPPTQSTFVFQSSVTTGIMTTGSTGSMTSTTGSETSSAEMIVSSVMMAFILSLLF